MPIARRINVCQVQLADLPRGPVCVLLEHANVALEAAQDRCEKAARAANP